MRWPDGGAAPERLPGDAVLDRADVQEAALVAARRALEEDLGDAGDVTSDATVAPRRYGEADLVARAGGIVAGLDLVAIVYDLVDPRVTADLEVADGDQVPAGHRLGSVAGPLRSVLTGERTALNFATHLSGIATRTRAFVDVLAGTSCVVRDTRKTTPGLRLLEKVAVRAGGGVNHRIGLFDALLVKDNHVAAAGSLKEAVTTALTHARGRHVQVEVRTVEEAEVAIAAGARDLLLDNLDQGATRELVARVRALEAVYGRILLESSGTISLETARAYADAGVDRLAIGAITHSAPQLDLALDVRATTTVPDGA